MIKNILITGLPKTGKTTLLEKLLLNLVNHFGFITQEVKKQGKRVGFEIIDHENNIQLLSHIDTNSNIRVGKYGVDIEYFDKLLPKYFGYKKSDVLYLDEIGEMELNSDLFIILVDKYLESENLFIGTISQKYTDDFIERIKTRDDTVLYHLTEENRDEIFEKMNYHLLKNKNY